MTTFGFHVVHPKIEPDRLPRLADLLLDPRWPFARPHLSVRQLPGTAPTFPVRAKPEPLRPAVVAAVESPLVERLGLAASRVETADHAWIYVEPGPWMFPLGRFPYSVRARCRMPAADPAAIDRWVSLAHELVAVVGGAHGVIVAGDDEEALQCEIWLINIGRNGGDAHPDPRMITTLAADRDKLGDSYIRPPQWGTYLAPRHVDAVGGRAAIAAIAPVMRDVGDLLYVQLSETAATAVTPDVATRLAALTELLAPIIIPRRP